MAGVTTSLEQKCESFYYRDWASDTYRKHTRTYYICQINGNLVNDQEEVTTDTSENERSDEEVTAVDYNHSYTVKFIPNSIFQTFRNLEYLYISSNNQFDTMKREYLRHAKKLKNLWFHYSDLEKINGNVFVEAKRLEHINFQHGKIKSIHKDAFHGLPVLKGVYLNDNQIKYLHPRTFSIIPNLYILELSGEANCVDEKIVSANNKFPAIESKISQHCTLPDEVIDEPKVEDESLKQVKITIQKANVMIGNLTADVAANQEKIKEMTDEFEQMKAKLNAKITEQQKELTKIASEKLELEAKLATQQKECKSELQLEFTNHKDEIEAKLTAQKMELLQECKSEVLQESAKHNIEVAKLSGQMLTLQNIYLALGDRISDLQKESSTCLKHIGGEK